MPNAIKHRIYSFALIALLSAEPALATSILEMNLETLTKQSSNVVSGRVVNQHSQFDDNNKIIWTYSTLAVDQGIKGGELDTLVIQQAGGAVGDISQIVHGISLLKPSEEVLLFVAPTDPAASSFKITGLSQGMYRISANAQGERIATPVIDAQTHYMAPSAVGKLVHTKPSATPMAVQQLIETIRSID